MRTTTWWEPRWESWEYCCWAMSSGVTTSCVFWAVSVAIQAIQTLSWVCKCQKCSTTPAFEESLQLVARYFKKEFLFRHQFLVLITRLILSKHNISQKQSESQNRTSWREEKSIVFGWLLVEKLWFYSKIWYLRKKTTGRQQDFKRHFKYSREIIWYS